VENVPGKSNIIPGRPRKCSASARNRVHLHPGMVFRISPEYCSASPRNRVHLRADSPCNRINLKESESLCSGLASSRPRGFGNSPFPHCQRAWCCRITSCGFVIPHRFDSFDCHWIAFTFPSTNSGLRAG